MDISNKEQQYLRLFIEYGQLRSSDVFERLSAKGEAVSLATVKRTLSTLAHKKLLAPIGSGRSSSYSITVLGRLYTDVNPHEYCAIEPDNRFGMKSYNFDLFANIPEEIFSQKENNILESATVEYVERSKNLPIAIERKELERLIIELSWKSSRIEGNTYTLLDTERLILENKEAIGHNPSEAKMILNHKDAFTFVRDNASEYETITRRNLEQLHSILVKDLSIGTGIRSRSVGIVGSTYRPLDTAYQLQEGIDALSLATSRAKSPYSKAILALLGVSYLQPFEDGNKRTARLVANAVLLAYGCAPLSYRSVDENAYRSSTLVFYELNSLSAFKKIFIEQYDFAARNYAVVKA